jgi:plastocyanin
MRRVTVIVGLAFLVVAAPASSGNLVTLVTVSAAGPKPALAKARVAKPVTWTNATGVRHRVVWSGGRFPSFTLSPHGRHTFHFAAAGRYPYIVDGSKHGAVLVSAGGAASGGSSGKGKPPPKTWSGLFRSDAASDGGSGYQACSTSWAGTLHFTVASGGSITGSGVADEVPGTAQCALYLDPKRIDGVDYSVGGTIAGTKITLSFSVTGVRGGPDGEGSGLLSHLSFNPTFTLTFNASGHAGVTKSFQYPFGNGGTVTTHDTLSLSGS